MLALWWPKETGPAPSRSFLGWEPESGSGEEHGQAEAPVVLAPLLVALEVGSARILPSHLDEKPPVVAAVAPARLLVSYLDETSLMAATVEVEVVDVHSRRDD